MIKKIYNKGYTLLFAVLTATLVLGVAIFILNVSMKQFELAVAARNSIYSFYAADSGIECAVNWFTFASTTGGALSCAGNTSAAFTPTSGDATTLLVDWPAFVPTSGEPNPNPVRQWSGYVSLSSALSTATIKPCAYVSITTGWDSATNQRMTIIDSRGYNLCTGSSPDVASPATVERALRLFQAGVW